MTEPKQSGSVSSNANMETKDLLINSFFFILWYASSCVATISTKLILHGNILQSRHLLVLQLFLSIVYLKIFDVVGILNLTISIAHVKQLKHLFLAMSIVYVIGFLLLQASLQMVSVSFAVTARGSEPVLTCFFGLIFLSENVTIIQWLAVFLIVVGVSFCTGSDKSWTVAGLGVLFACNLCFSLRSLIVKFMHTRTNKFNLERLSGQKIYFVTCIIGSTMMSCWLFGSFLFFDSSPSLVSFSSSSLSSSMSSSSSSSSSTTSSSSAASASASASTPMSPFQHAQRLRDHFPMLAVNSACFTLYNVSSYILLGKIQLSYHAIGNSVRQVVVISFSIFFLGSTLTVYNVFGIACVATGAACYSIFGNKKRSTQVQNVFTPVIGEDDKV